jgi:hypothetical protein
VEGREVEEAQKGEGSKVVCRMEAGALSFYSGERVPWGSGQVRGDDGARGS